MDRRVVEVTKQGRGKILTPGNPDNIHPLTELLMDIRELQQLHEVEVAQIRHDMKCQFDVLESHIQDVEKVSKAKLRDMISCIKKLEKLVVEISLKT